MKTSIVAYGGSIIIPGNTYSEDALQDLKKIILQNSDTRFIIIIGGGKLCRNINSLVGEVLDTALGKDSEMKNDSLDELGIAATKINSRYTLNWLRKELGEDIVYENYIDNPEVLPKTDARVIIASGFRPGVTTDYCMMRFAQNFNADSAYKISNFPIVLNVKPNEFQKEKLGTYEKIPKMTWDEMLNLVGEEAIAGGNYPLDPPSAVLGNKIIKTKPNFTLYIGEKQEFSKMLKNETFYGTVISNY